jgi:hypothetical protein
MGLFKALQMAKQAHAEGRLAYSLKNRLDPYFKGALYSFSLTNQHSIEISCPPLQSPSSDKEEVELVRRIFTAYKKAKSAQNKPEYAPFLPSKLWIRQIEKSYDYFQQAINEDSVDKFHYFLNNFGTWPKYHGVESNVLLHRNNKPILQNYLKMEIFKKGLDFWKWMSGEQNLALLSYPRHGNQAGALIDGHFVGAGSFGNQVYGKMLAGMVSDRNRPLIADLGAGYGKLAYFILKNMERFCFLDFDLPETLALASYYLMKTWPEKKALLYGEGQFNSDAAKKYDFIFMPCFEIGKSRDMEIDLFVNKNSLGEMTRESIHAYVDIICSCARYFCHMNHEHYPNIYENGDRSLLNSEYPIPTDTYKQIYRGPDVFSIYSGRKLSAMSDIFYYTYERIASRDSHGRGNNG